jgi:hypothetical protein
VAKVGEKPAFRIGSLSVNPGPFPCNFGFVLSCLTMPVSAYYATSEWVKGDQAQQVAVIQRRLASSLLVKRPAPVV